MCHDVAGQGRSARIARVVFACVAILIISGAGQRPQSESDQVPAVEAIEERPDLRKIAEDYKKAAMDSEKAEENSETSVLPHRNPEEEARAAAYLKEAEQDLKKTAEDIKKAEQELKRTEDLYARKSIGKDQRDEACRKLLELKVSALEEELLLGKIRLAKSYLARAEERVDLARQTDKKGEYIKYWRTSEGLTLQMAQFRLEQAERQLTVYLRYTRPLMRRNLEVARQVLEEGEAAQRLVLAARPNGDDAKALSNQTGQGIAAPWEAKSEWRKLAERRLEERITGIGAELSPARWHIKQHEDEIVYTNKLHRATYIPESEVGKEKLALQHIMDFLKETRGKVEELRRSSTEVDGAKALNHEAGAFAIPGEESARITLKGIARERGTGRPIEGAMISFGARFSLGQIEALTDKEGRYELVGLPEADEYSVVGDPLRSEIHFVTTARVKPAKKGEKIVNLDLDFVRGIPYRVRVLDKATGKPLLHPKTGNAINGLISYFPVTPNDPDKPEVWRDSKAQKIGVDIDAFNESGGVDENGDYHGTVLPGPGVLCFATNWAKNLKNADRQPSFFFPDGKDAVRILTRDKPPVSAILVPIRGSSRSLAIGLGQYTAVIAINPREDAKEVSYEIMLDQAEAMR